MYYNRNGLRRNYLFLLKNFLRIEEKIFIFTTCTMFHNDASLEITFAKQQCMNSYF